MRGRVLVVAITVLVVAGCARQPGGSGSEGPSPIPSPHPSVVAVATVPAPSPRESPKLEPSIEVTPTIEPQPTPTDGSPATPILLICPSSPPTQALRVSEFLQLDTTCLGSATIAIVGWQDDLPGIDFGEGEGIDPGWLIYPPTTSVLYDRALTSTHTCRPINDCPILLVHIAPDSSLTFTGHNRWLRVTGHVNDPASTACHFVYPPGTPEGDKSPDDLAVQACLTSFVLEKVEVTTAP